MTETAAKARPMAAGNHDADVTTAGQGIC